jgi:DNA repair protein RecO (recombination protein O)
MRTLEGSDPELLGRIFEAKLLDALGYRPQFEGCVMEHHDERQVLQPGGTTTGPVWFSIERGGVLCPACAATCPGALTLSPPTVAALTYFLRSPMDRAVHVRIEKRNRLELASFLHSFICYHGDVRPRSWQFTR